MRNASPDESTTRSDRGSCAQAASVRITSVEAPQSLGDAAFLRWMKTTIEAARRVARSMLLYRVGSHRHAALAAQLGVTHASLRE